MPPVHKLQLPRFAKIALEIHIAIETISNWSSSIFLVHSHGFSGQNFKTLTSCSAFALEELRSEEGPGNRPDRSQFHCEHAVFEMRQIIPTACHGMP